MRIHSKPPAVNWSCVDFYCRLWRLFYPRIIVKRKYNSVPSDQHYIILCILYYDTRDGQKCSPVYCTSCARIHRIAIQMIEAIYYFVLFCPTLRVFTTNTLAYLHQKQFVIHVFGTVHTRSVMFIQTIYTRVGFFFKYVLKTSKPLKNYQFKFFINMFMYNTF